MLVEVPTDAFYFLVTNAVQMSAACAYLILLLRQPSAD
jgi:hypothetical protein